MARLDNIVLTILIPTYNRAERVSALVQFLLTEVEYHSGRVAIVVSNNVSSDNTSLLLSSVRSPYFELHDRTVHLPTVEEHMFQAVHLCHSPYVWFLGDDDMPILYNIRYVVSLLSELTHDFLVFNSMTITNDNSAAGGWIAQLDDEIFKTPFPEGVSLLGYTSAFAGISNSIMRVAPLKRVDCSDLVSIQSIYSHVMWWMLAFRDVEMTICNRLLLHYRLDVPGSTGPHFISVAERQGVPDYHFWSTGLIAQFRYLEEKRAMDARHLASMFETRGDGTYFRLMDDVVSRVHDQVVSGAKGDTRNRISWTDLLTATDYVLRIDAGYFSCVELIHDIHYIANEPDAFIATGRYKPSKFLASLEVGPKHQVINILSHRFSSRLVRKAETLNSMIGMFGQFRGFDLYTHLTEYVAFDTLAAVDRRAVLRKFVIHSLGPNIVVASTEKNLIEKISAIRSSQRSRRDLAYDAYPKYLSSSALHVESGRGSELLDPKTTQAETSNAGPGLQLITIPASWGEMWPEPLSKKDLVAFSKLSRRKSIWGIAPGVSSKTVLPGFDGSFYTSNNPKSSADPLLHFLQIGWREGKNPSAHFNTQGYLDANPDVRAAGVNPLLHFVEYGYREGRIGWRVPQPARIL